MFTWSIKVKHYFILVYLRWSAAGFLLPQVQRNFRKTVELCRSERRKSRQTRTEFSYENRKVLETHGNHHHPGWAVSSWTIKGGNGPRINNWHVEGNEALSQNGLFSPPPPRFNLCFNKNCTNLHLFWGGVGAEVIWIRLPALCNTVGGNATFWQRATLRLTFLICLGF